MKQKSEDMPRSMQPPIQDQVIYEERAMTEESFEPIEQKAPTPVPAQPIPESNPSDFEDKYLPQQEQ